VNTLINSATAYTYLVLEREELKAVAKATHDALLRAAENSTNLEYSEALHLCSVLRRLLEDEAALNTAEEFLVNDETSVKSLKKHQEH